MSNNQIHSTAVIESGAELEGVSVGPYCVIKRGARIAAGTQLLSHIYIDGDTHIGRDNMIYPFTSIGAPPQDLKYRGELSRVRIGDNNQIRESVTIHRGTQGGIMETRIGNHCLLMANAHIAHDCVLEDHVIITNCASLGGHVLVQKFAILGGLAGVRQFCKIGTRAFLTAGAMVTLDVPPFCIADGADGPRAGLVGLNIEGLKRAQYSDERISQLKKAYREFFLPGRTREEALAIVSQNATPDVLVFIDFIKQSERGILRPRPKN